MIASKLTFNSEMLEALSSPMLTPEKKRNLRKSRVIDYVKNHKDEEIHIATLIREAGYNPKYIEGDDSYKNGWALIDNMVRSKAIYKEKSKVRGFAKYWTSSRVKAIIAPTPEIALETAKNVIEIPKITNSSVLLTNGEVVEIVRKAKQFAWDHNSDSLRDFIKSLQ